MSDLITELEVLRDELVSFREDLIDERDWLSNQVLEYDRQIKDVDIQIQAELQRIEKENKGDDDPIIHSNIFDFLPLRLDEVVPVNKGDKVFCYVTYDPSDSTVLDIFYDIGPTGTDAEINSGFVTIEYDHGVYQEAVDTRYIGHYQPYGQARHVIDRQVLVGGSLKDFLIKTTAEVVDLSGNDFPTVQMCFNSRGFLYKIRYRSMRKHLYQFYKRRFEYRGEIAHFFRHIKGYSNVPNRNWIKVDR